MKKVLYFTGLILSALYLFTLRTETFLGSTILSYVLATISIFIILSFFYFYSPFYKAFFVFQLKELQKKSATNWFSWFSENIKEFTNIFLFTFPYVLLLVSLLKALGYLFEPLAFLNTVSLIGMSMFCMAMVFVFITDTFTFFHNRTKTSTH